jgi:hypothetical protein
MTTTQVGTKLGIRKITARIGAEITGLPPDLILDPETIAAVRAALNEPRRSSSAASAWTTRISSGSPATSAR